jgi:hypothetical protein
LAHRVSSRFWCGEEYKAMLMRDNHKEIRNCMDTSKLDR